MASSIAGSGQALEVSFKLEIHPSSHCIDDNADISELPTLSISATLHESQQPITIFTWPTILNPQLALRRKNFYCLDLTDGRKPLFLEITKGPKRCGFQHTKGSYDDEYHITLMPGEPVVFSTRFGPAFRTDGRGSMVPGHTYLFGVADGEIITWWREGTRDQVLTEREDAEQDLRPPILIKNVKPVQFVAEI